MSSYFIHDGKEQKGPFILEELKTQTINPNTSIWHEGLAEWTTANKLEELQTLFIKVPPPINIEKIPTSKNKIYLIVGILFAVILITSGVIFYIKQQSKHEAEMKAAQVELEQKNKDAEKAISDVKAELERKNILAINEKQNAQLLEAKQAFYRNEWKKHIILTGSKYMILSFGGIKGLDLTISNGTTYKIDNIEVSVEYVKDNGGIFKTEKVNFNNIPAGMTMTLPAPESERGMSVKISILKITASSFHFCYDRSFEMEGSKNGLSTSPNGISGNPNDPWVCN